MHAAAPTPPAVTPHEPLNGRWGVRPVLVWVAVALPWINPFATGPSPNTVPLLVSGFCTLLLVAACGTATQRRSMRTHPGLLFTAWAAAALLASAMGLAQYFGLADGLAPWVHPAHLGEAYANLRQRNQFASLTSIGLVSVLYGATHLAASHHKGLRTAQFALTGGALALLALANAASASRTGALQWLLVGVWAAGYSRPGKRMGVVWAVGALLLYGLAVATLPTVLHSTTGLTHGGLMGRLAEPAGCESRRILWANVVELIAQKPWWGWGWGELKFAHFSHPYSGERFCALLDNAHNLPLHLAVEGGLPLAGVACAGTGWLLWRGTPWRETQAARQSAWAILALIGLHSLVEYPLWYGPFQMAVALCTWLLWRSPPERGDARAGIHLAWVGCLVFLLYTAWDYTRVSQLYLPAEQRWAVFRVDTLEKARASHLFAHEVQFAELATTPTTVETATRQYALARQLLHFSPEPRVLQTLLESGQLRGLTADDLLPERLQFQRAYPDAFAPWQATQAPFKLDRVSPDATAVPYSP